MVDTKYEINCPACGGKMTKIFIPRLSINLDICTDGCGGIYFDNQELKNFDDNEENIDEIIEALKNKDFKKVDESATRVCPVCGANMVKNYASPKRETEIDECYSCGGKFLDCGELQKIREEFTNEDEMTDFLYNELYAKKGQELMKLDSEVALIKPRQQSILKKIFLSVVG